MLNQYAFMGFVLCAVNYWGLVDGTIAGERRDW